MGHEIKLLLVNLPNKLAEILHHQTSSTVIKIWKDFGVLYFKHISSWEPGNYQCFQEKAKEWIRLFLSLSQKQLGYANKDITPYMHIMVFHIPQFMGKYKTVKQFSGQGVEKNNDDARHVVLSKSNNWDSPTDVLRSEYRQWALQSRERTPRQYSKKDESYWADEIKEARKKRVRITHETREDLVCEPIRNLEDMSAEELKEELKKYGISQFGRKRKPGLLKMLRDAINC